MEHNQPRLAGEYAGENEKISQPAQIASLLRRAHEERALLTVTVPGSDEQYKSVILEVNLAKHYVLLDELHPPAGHGRFLAEKKFRAHTHLKGVEISFAGVLQDSAQENGMALYRVALPAFILYRQRRTSYRVHVGAGLAIPVILDNENLRHLQGILCDISAGGIGLRLKSEQPLAIEHGAIFPVCEIQLPHNERIHTGLELRFVSPVDQRHMVRFGGRFLSLEPADQKRVEHFVVALERELLKKRTKD